jgi:glycosyltransferase involved in cell wall biosynthesis
LSKLRVKCLAPVLDRSGYAQWSRAYIKCLINAGVDLTISTPSFDRRFDEQDPAIAPLLPYLNKDLPYDIVIAWLLPDIAAKLFEQEEDRVKKVVFTLWETSRIPDRWVQSINDNADECWLPGPWNTRIFGESGVETSIKYFNHPIDFKDYEIDSTNIQSNITDNTYVFYFISQWSERKNFNDLLETYWSTFSEKDDVALVLKTHIHSSSREDNETLSRHIRHLKSQSSYGTTAPVQLVTDFFTTEQLLALHHRGDCYVSCSRGEGLGLGILEAGIFGNSVIACDFGEHSSYVVSPSSGLLVNCSLRPVTRMGAAPLYTSDQRWAQPDLDQFSQYMRDCYENQSKAKERGLTLQEQLRQGCNPEEIGKSLLSNLERLANENSKDTGRVGSRDQKGVIHTQARIKSE